MKIAVFGAGTVGTTIATKLVELGHSVIVASRDRNAEGDKSPKAQAWLTEHAGKLACLGSYAEAAAYGELVFNCTAGTGSLEALRMAGPDALAGKILIDLANPLDFSKGMPPTLFVGNDDSLGEQIQRLLPDTRVVKTLNTVNCNVMVDAARVPGEHTMFMAGNDADAKLKVREILTEWFGWKSVLDLGDITAARGTEGYLLLWLRMWGALGTADFNVTIARR